METRDWPNDADGDVLRQLRAKGFDFSKTYLVDFNVDFENWPPSQEAIRALQAEFPNAEVYEDAESGGYVLFKVNNKLTYDLVIETQARATTLVAKYGGRCESWGVLHD